MLINNKGISKVLAVIAVVIALVLVVAVVGLQAGLFGIGEQQSTPTPAPTMTPTECPTATPTEAPATSTPQPTVEATPTLPPPSLSVSVVGSDYNDEWGQFTTFTCTVTINNHGWDSLVSNFVAANDITVTDAMSMNQVTGDIATTLPAVFPQLNMNYGISESMVISGAVNGQFTITLHSEQKSVLSGGINTDTLASALTDKINILFATQT
jgi:hypothetical protein